MLELAEDVLVLDRDNSDARLLRTLAERHVDLSHPDRDRRHETVVFADLVGSTALANRFDPEFVQRLTLTYEQACSPVLIALGGHVHRFVGDGILASFGYPTSHEDDAQRAVQAALDLAETVAATSAGYRHLGIELQVRVGVASGVLVHADRGSGSWTQPGDLFGPAVNLAARIHEIAEPGEVCISNDTAGLVAGFFELTSLGPHQLKGFDTPIEIHRVLGRTRATGWFDRAGRIASPFLGHVDELARLRTQWDGLGSVDGPPSDVVLITGDPGVGKSRILRELLERTADDSRSVIELRCSAYRATSPLYPVRSAIERYAGFEPGDDDELRLAKLERILEAGGLVVSDALPYLAMLLEVDAGERAPRPESSPAQVRAVTLRELRHWLTALRGGVADDADRGGPPLGRPDHARTAAPGGERAAARAARADDVAHRAGVARGRRARHDRPRPAHPRRDAGARAGRRRRRTCRCRSWTRSPGAATASRCSSSSSPTTGPAPSPPASAGRSRPASPSCSRPASTGPGRRSGWPRSPRRSDGSSSRRSSRRSSPASRTRASSTPSIDPCASTSTGSSRAT